MNTKQSQTNTFAGGINMDTHPLTTPENILTDCVNGTLLTYNGNEFVLQNDMGNVKLAEAKLTDGYVPVAAKEHGGIIYIVSYNPKENLTEIGTYPSPLPITDKDSYWQSREITNNIEETKEYYTSNLKFPIKLYSEDDNFVITPRDKYKITEPDKLSPFFKYEYYLFSNGKYNKINIIADSEQHSLPIKTSGLLASKLIHYSFEEFSMLDNISSLKSNRQNFLTLSYSLVGNDWNWKDSEVEYYIYNEYFLTNDKGNELNINQIFGGDTGSWISINPTTNGFEGKKVTFKDLNKSFGKFISFNPKMDFENWSNVTWNADNNTITHNEIVYNQFLIESTIVVNIKENGDIIETYKFDDIAIHKTYSLETIANTYDPLISYKYKLKQSDGETELAWDNLNEYEQDGNTIVEIELNLQNFDPQNYENITYVVVTVSKLESTLNDIETIYPAFIRNGDSATVEFALNHQVFPVEEVYVLKLNPIISANETAELSPYVVQSDSINFDLEKSSNIQVIDKISAGLDWPVYNIYPKPYDWQVTQATLCFNVESTREGAESVTITPQIDGNDTDWSDQSISNYSIDESTKNFTDGLAEFSLQFPIQSAISTITKLPSFKVQIKYGDSSKIFCMLSIKHPSELPSSWDRMRSYNIVLVNSVLFNSVDTNRFDTVTFDEWAKQLNDQLEFEANSQYANESSIITYTGQLSNKLNDDILKNDKYADFAKNYDYIYESNQVSDGKILDEYKTGIIEQKTDDVYISIGYPTSYPQIGIWKNAFIVINERNNTFNKLQKLGTRSTKIKTLIDVNVEETKKNFKRIYLWETLQAPDSVLEESIYRKKEGYDNFDGYIGSEEIYQDRYHNFYIQCNDILTTNNGTWHNGGQLNIYNWDKILTLNDYTSNYRDITSMDRICHFVINYKNRLVYTPTFNDSSKDSYLMQIIQKEYQKLGSLAKMKLGTNAYLVRPVMGKWYSAVCEGTLGWGKYEYWEDDTPADKQYYWIPVMYSFKDLRIIELLAKNIYAKVPIDVQTVYIPTDDAFSVTSETTSYVPSIDNVKLRMSFYNSGVNKYNLVTSNFDGAISVKLTATIDNITNTNHFVNELQQVCDKLNEPVIDQSSIYDDNLSTNINSCTVAYTKDGEKLWGMSAISGNVESIGLFEYEKIVEEFCHLLYYDKEINRFYRKYDKNSILYEGGADNNNPINGCKWFGFIATQGDGCLCGYGHYYCLRLGIYDSIGEKWDGIDSTYNGVSINFIKNE